MHYKIFLIFALLFLPIPTYAQRPPTIAAILSLTGQGQATGTAIKNGMIMAAEELGKNSINLIFEDDAYIPKNTVNAFQKILASDHPDAFVCLGGTTCNAISSLAENHKIPLFALSSNSSTALGKSFIHLFWISPESVSSLALKELSRRNITRIARVNADHEGRAALQRAFDQLNNHAVNIPIDAAYPPSTIDFKPFLLRIKNHTDTIDAIAINLLYGQIGLFAHQAREMNIQIPFFGFELHGTPEEIHSSQGALKGSWYVGTNLGTEKFQREYTKQFPGASLLGAANGHDIVEVFSQALLANSSKISLNDSIHDIQHFEGALGVCNRENSFRFNLPGEIKVVE